MNDIYIFQHDLFSVVNATMTYFKNVIIYFFCRYGGGAFSFSRLITGITANFNTEFDLKLVRQYY